ncbi:hypothetical protein [Halarcobacter sp.]|uniref:hypothetical protein n=1 Tax=Halarcobacter sp. TaxID=2321133 RepID=UPI0029F52342|nr:hypothetical protein [Halarcobacter sp.]
MNNTTITTSRGTELSFNSDSLFFESKDKAIFLEGKAKFKHLEKDLIELESLIDKKISLIQDKLNT